MPLGIDVAGWAADRVRQLQWRIDVALNTVDRSVLTARPANDVPWCALLDQPQPDRAAEIHVIAARNVTLASLANTMRPKNGARNPFAW